jgi:hypothetical protein
MIRLILLAALTLPAMTLAAAAPVLTQDAPMSLEQCMMLRCSAAFAIVANDQARGAASAGSYPALGTRGREYFVRAGAALMDELHITREELAARLKAEVERLQAQSAQARDPAAFVAGVMQPCLSALDASGL